MIDYLKCVQKLHPTFTETDINLIDDGVITIGYWNPAYGEVPTLSELEAVWLDVLKDDKKLEIKNTVYDELDNGTSGYTTQGLTTNFKVDSGRGDLDNFKNLMIYAQLNTLPMVPVKDFNNEMHYISLEDLQIIIYELIGYGLWLFQHKWEKENEINQAATIAEVESVSFF